MQRSLTQIGSIQLQEFRLGFRQLSTMIGHARLRVTPVLLLGLCFAAAAENAEAAVAKDIFRLGFQILKDFAADEMTNFVMSPSSIHSVLSILLPGAGGNSAAEIKSLLGSDPTAAQNEYLTILEGSRGASGEKIINSTSHIFYKKGSEINQDFRDNAEKNFRTGFSEIDPTNEEAATAISDWLKNTANATLDGVNFAVDSDIVILNAIQFKDDWAEEFDPRDTSDGIFHRNTVDSAEVDFLVKRDASVVSGKNDDLGAKWIHIPYKKDFKMVLILPVKRFALGELIRKMSASDLEAIIKADAATNASIVIPKFDVDYDFAVEMRLKKLGVKEIFTSQANLTGMSVAPLKVDNILQTCRIRIDEKGTTATAKTMGSLDFHRGSLAFPTDAFFLADEPFLFVILAGEVPLFTGVVVRPKVNII